MKEFIFGHIRDFLAQKLGFATAEEVFDLEMRILMLEARLGKNPLQSIHEREMLSAGLFRGYEQ